MKTYKKIMDKIALAEKIVMSVLLLYVTAIVFANVIVRKFTDFQLAWTEEIVINVFVLLIMLGCAMCVREGSMISLSLILSWTGAKGKKVVTVIDAAVITTFWVILFKTGWDKVLTQIANGKRTFSLGWPEWVFTIFLPVGCIFLILHNIEYLVDVLAKPDRENEESGKEQQK